MVIDGISSTLVSCPGTGGLITSANLCTKTGRLYPFESGKLFPPSDATPYVTDLTS